MDLGIKGQAALVTGGTGLDRFVGSSGTDRVLDYRLPEYHHGVELGVP